MSICVVYVLFKSQLSSGTWGDATAQLANTAGKPPSHASLESGYTYGSFKWTLGTRVPHV